MINTGAGPDANPYTFHLRGLTKSLKGSDIDVEVYKDDQWMPIEARQGEAAAKIAVAWSDEREFEYCSERENIADKYSNFAKWVEGMEPVVWW